MLEFIYEYPMALCSYIFASFYFGCAELGSGLSYCLGGLFSCLAYIFGCMQYGLQSLCQSILWVMSYTPLYYVYIGIEHCIGFVFYSTLTFAILGSISMGLSPSLVSKMKVEVESKEAEVESKEAEEQVVAEQETEPEAKVEQESEVEAEVELEAEEEVEQEDKVASPMGLPALRPFEAVKELLAVSMTGLAYEKEQQKKRSDMSLYEASIQIGKTFLMSPDTAAVSTNTKPTGSAMKKSSPYGLYCLRVECHQLKTKKEDATPDNVSKNAVMWDLQCRFSDFVTLAKCMRQENSTIDLPSLPSKLVFHIQTTPLLQKRKIQLQAFVNEITTRQELAEMSSVREFFHVMPTAEATN